MRYTRNRQMIKLHSGWYRKNKNYTIEIMRKRLKYHLDPTFKWHREYIWWVNRIVNWVEFDAQINGCKGTTIIPVKRYNGGTKTIQK